MTREFDKTGQLGTNIRGGRVVLFEKTDTVDVHIVRRYASNFGIQTPFESLCIIKNLEPWMLSRSDSKLEPTIFFIISFLATIIR